MNDKTYKRLGTHANTDTQIYSRIPLMDLPSNPGTPTCGRFGLLALLRTKYHLSQVSGSDRFYYIRFTCDLVSFLCVHVFVCGCLFVHVSPCVCACVCEFLKVRTIRVHTPATYISSVFRIGVTCKYLRHVKQAAKVENTGVD